VIAIDARRRRDGKYLDNIGYYDPKHNPAVVKIDEEKAIKWLQVGAQPTETVRSLLRKTGVLKKWHEMRYVKEGTKEEKAESKPKVSETPVKKPKAKSTTTKEKKEVKEPKEPKTKKAKPVVSKPSDENVSEEIVVVATETEQTPTEITTTEADSSEISVEQNEE
jgi:small subunit ribosomal protein S16